MTQSQIQKTENFPTMLQRYQAEIQKALPKHLNADRIARIALTSFRKNPRLGQCDPKGVFACVLMAAQLGFEIGLGGQAHLVPYRNNKTGQYECQLIPGWLGMVDLVFRSGKAMVMTGAVYEGDDFEYALGDQPFVQHRPAKHQGELVATYAIGRIKHMQWPVVEVWPVEKIEVHRDRYNKVGKDHYSYENFEQYGRKVALMQVLKYLPKSAEVQTAMALDHAASSATLQNLTTSEVVEGTWLPEETEPTPAPQAAPPQSSTEAVKEKLKANKQTSVDEIWPKKDEPPKDAA